MNIILCVYFALAAVAIPSSISPRNKLPHDTGVFSSVNITNHDNVEITPDFKILVYTEPQIARNDSLSNLTVQPRNSAATHRPITLCPNEAFVESHCTPQHDQPGSLQSYSITCAHYVEHRDPWSGEFQESRLVHTRRSGFCAKDEICIDKMRSNLEPPLPRWAICVSKSLFDGTMYGPGEGESVQMINRVLEKGAYKGTYMVISHEDGTTPTEVDTFDIDTWPEVGSIQNQKCRDCMNLETGTLASDINALKVEARLLTAGATAGILWLALIAG